MASQVANDARIGEREQRISLGVCARFVLPGADALTLSAGRGWKLTGATDPADPAGPAGSAGPVGRTGPAEGDGHAEGAAEPGAGGETEPDARFTFANERTFLAWTRTALAFVVGGLAIVQLLPPFPGVPWGRHLLGVPLIVLGAVISVASYTEWAHSQHALRRSEPLPRSLLPRILAVTITCLSVVAAVVVIMSAVLKP